MGRFMNTDHSIHVDDALRRMIERIAQSQGMTPDQVVREAVAEFSESHDASTPMQNNSTSLFDRAASSGLIGCLESLPSDLSTNKSYMEGFGRAQD
jgi:hypothetical protein